MIQTLQLNLKSNFETHSTKTKILHEKLYFGIQVNKAYRKKKTFNLPIFVAFVIFKVYICIYVYLYVYIIYIHIYIYIYMHMYYTKLHKNIKKCPAQDQEVRTQIFMELK